MEDKSVLEYLNYLKWEKAYSDNTIDRYKMVYNTYFKFLEQEKTTVLKASYQNVKDFVYQLYILEYKPSTISNYISALKSLYKYLYEHSYIKNNIMVNIPYPKKENKLFKIMYTKELKSFFESVDANSKYPIRDRLLFLMLYTTGMRVFECSNLEISNINFSSNTVKVYGKGKKERIIPLKEEVVLIIKKYMNGEREQLLKSKNHTYLFVNKDGEQLTDRGIRYLATKYCIKSSENLMVSPHTFRHTLATNLLNNGMDLRSIQTILGHESLSTTEKYTHLSKNDLRNKYLDILEN